MQSNNVIFSLPLIAGIYLQIRGNYRYKRLHCLFIHGLFFFVSSDNFWSFVLVDYPEPNPDRLYPVLELCHCLWCDNVTKQSSAQSFLHFLIFAKIWTWHLQSGPTLCSQLHCACLWDASLFQSQLHPATFAVSSSEMLPLVWAAHALLWHTSHGTRTAVRTYRIL